MFVKSVQFGVYLLQQLSVNITSTYPFHRLQVGNKTFCCPNNNTVAHPYLWKICSKSHHTDLKPKKIPLTSLYTSGYNCSKNLVISLFRGNQLTSAEQVKDERYINNSTRHALGAVSSPGYWAITNHLTTVCKVLSVHSQCKQPPRYKGILISNYLVI